MNAPVRPMADAKPALADPKTEFKFHPHANLFPLMEGKEFEAFVKDIETHGQQEPVTVYHEYVLEGRNRIRACQQLKLQIKLKEYTGSDPLGFVLSANLHRRHLNETQRGIVAAKVANMRRGGKEANPSNDGIEKTSQEQAAKLLNVSTKTVERAAKLLDKGAPELVQAAEQGRVKVSAAKKLLEKSKEEQQKLIRDNEGVAKAIKSLKSERVLTAEVAANVYHALHEQLLDALDDLIKHSSLAHATEKANETKKELDRKIEEAKPKMAKVA